MERFVGVVATASLMKYYSVEDDVTLQCDASRSGLGAALRRHGQPVAYASRALLSAETRMLRSRMNFWLLYLPLISPFGAFMHTRDNSE